MDLLRGQTCEMCQHGDKLQVTARRNRTTQTTLNKSKIKYMFSLPNIQFPVQFVVVLRSYTTLNQTTG